MEGFGNFTAMIGNRFVTNLKGSFADMTPEKFIRIVIIVGTCAYFSNGIIPNVPPFPF
jgi:hypothetical protein